MATNDQRSSSLPDGFTRGDSEIDPFAKVSRGARDNFAKSGEVFDPWAEVEAKKSRDEEIGETVVDVTMREMSPELRKMIGLDLGE